MAFSIRKLGRRFFVMVNLVVCGLFLLSVFQPFLNPDVFWFIGFMSISLPYLLVLVIGFLLFWLLLKRGKYMLISAIAIGLGYQQIGNIINFSETPKTLTKSTQNLRVITWNIQGFRGNPNQDIAKNAESIMAEIAQFDPDVIALQEFGQFDMPDKPEENYAKLLAQMGYKHSVQSKDYSRKQYKYSSGLAIFSKHPFASTKRIPFTSSPESIIAANVVYNGDTVCIINTHLQSFNFSKSDYKELNNIQKADDIAVNASKNIISKMKRAFRNRGAQARQVANVIDSINKPIILCSDMNDVPNSYAYAKISYSLQDAFLEKGYGMGKTFKYLLPTLRIDYILTSPSFNIVQYQNTVATLSDHRGVVVDMHLKTDTTQTIVIAK